MRKQINYYIKETEEMFREGSSVAIDESHFLTTSEGVQIWVFGIVNIGNEIQLNYRIIYMEHKMVSLRY